MSIPNYYNDGHTASAEMKRDLARVRLAKPERYLTRKVKEQRHSTEGTVDVVVNREPDSLAMGRRARHEFWTRRAK